MNINFMKNRNKIYFLILLLFLGISYSVLLSQKPDNLKLSDEDKPQSTSKSDNLHYNIGILAAEKNDFETALQEFGLALTINPKNTFALYARATVLYQTQKYKESLSDLNLLLKLDKKYMKGIILRAVVYMELEKYPEAIEDYQTIIKNDPKNSDYYFRLGYCYQLSNSPDLAIKNYQTAEKLGANNEELYINLAALMYQAKNFDKSLDYIDKAIKKGAASNDIYSLSIYNYLEKGYCTEAENVFNKYSVKIENHARILMNLGICFLNKSELDKSISLFESSFKEDSTLIENVFNTGVAFLKGKELDSSYVKFEEFLKLSENRDDLEKLRIEARNQIDYLKDYNKKEKANWKEKK